MVYTTDKAKRRPAFLIHTSTVDFISDFQWLCNEIGLVLNVAVPLEMHRKLCFSRKPNERKTNTSKTGNPCARSPHTHTWVT